MWFILAAIPIALLLLFKRSTVIYYLHLATYATIVQLGFCLPFLYFPFRPFDYRNANATAKLFVVVERLFGIQYNLRGVENLRDEGGIVLINHQSAWDLVVLGYLWEKLGPAAVVSKKSLLFYPPLGPAMWSYGSVFIDRSNREAALKSLEIASQAIVKERKKLVFFPEGTRSVSDTMRPFKNGAFATAFDNKCLLFPVVVSKFTFIDHARKIFTPGTKTISVLEPVDARKFGDFKELRDHCQRVMQEEYDRLNAGGI